MVKIEEGKTVAFNPTAANDPLAKLDSLTMARKSPESVHERRMATDAEYKDRTIVLASRIPDARGLEDITEPFLKSKVADALDVSRSSQKMHELAQILSMKYPKSAARVKKRAEDLSRMGL